jgi:hypothetical protein
MIDIDMAALEEDPHLSFKVQNMLLFGILYCQADPLVRIRKFYELAQNGLQENICASDEELSEFIPMMARICYTGISI